MYIDSSGDNAKLLHGCFSKYQFNSHQVSGLPQLTAVFREGGKSCVWWQFKKCIHTTTSLCSMKGIAKIINFDFAVGLFGKRHYSVSETCILPPCSHPLTLYTGWRNINVLADWCYCKNPLLGGKNSFKTGVTNYIIPLWNTAEILS